MRTGWRCILVVAALCNVLAVNAVEPCSEAKMKVCSCACVAPRDKQTDKVPGLLRHAPHGAVAAARMRLGLRRASHTGSAAACARARPAWDCPPDRARCRDCSVPHNRSTLRRASLAQRHVMVRAASLLACAVCIVCALWLQRQRQCCICSVREHVWQDSFLTTTTMHMHACVHDDGANMRPASERAERASRGPQIGTVDGKVVVTASSFQVVSEEHGTVQLPHDVAAMVGVATVPAPPIHTHAHLHTPAREQAASACMQLACACACSMCARACPRARAHAHALDHARVHERTQRRACSVCLPHDCWVD